MNRYKISKIYIKNFKHINEVTFDLFENDLIILDGPNGFGKTTIFDAIELVITGKIDRIKNTISGNFGYEQILYPNDDSKETDIRIEFKNKDNSIVLGKYINEEKRLLSTEKKPDNWKVFETYQLSNFDAPISTKKLITYEKIEKLLGIKNLERFFNLFYYVQQEENTAFLKKSGRERMAALSSLFDTKKEQSELTIIKKAKRIVSNRKKSLEGSNGEIQKNIDFVRTLQIGIEDVKEESRKDVQYHKLIKNKDIEWDAEKLVLEAETRHKYLNELRSIYSLKTNLDSFLNKEFNNKLYKYLENRNLIMETINYSPFFLKYNEFEALKRKEISLKKLNTKLSRINIENSLKMVDFEDINELLGLDLDLEKIQKEIKELKSSKEKMKGFSKLIQQFEITRSELLEQFEKISDETDTDCPFCGSHFFTYLELIQSIEEQKIKFEKLLSNEGIEYKQKFDTFFNEYAINIKKEIELYLDTESNIIPDDFLTALSVSFKKKTEISEFVEWCIKHEIGIKRFYNQTEVFQILSESKQNGFLEFLESHLKKVSLDYKNHEINKFIFENIFDSQKSNILIIDKQDIINKSHYINYQFYNNSSNKINEYKQKVVELKKIKTKLDTQELKLKNIEEIYNQEITTHWQNIISDIEIPFYIFSGKIIQSYQLGCGLFIREKEDREHASIMFVSNMKNDHDAINYLSSGQLSGLIISFTLALNKVYEKKSLDVLMIDDPVQTMDEINIASFTELLRNEFSNKQIILSTHEEEISRYIRYKFQKYNLKTQRINVKEIIYNK